MDLHISYKLFNLFSPIKKKQRQYCLSIRKKYGCLLRRKKYFLSLGKKRALSLGKKHSLSLGKKHSLSLGKKHPLSLGNKHSLSLWKKHSLSLRNKRSFFLRKKATLLFFSLRKKHFLAVYERETLLDCLWKRNTSFFSLRMKRYLLLCYLSMRKKLNLTVKIKTLMSLQKEVVLFQWETFLSLNEKKQKLIS